MKKKKSKGKYVGLHVTPELYAVLQKAREKADVPLATLVRRFIVKAVGYK